MSKASAMGNVFEFQEIMAAAMQFGTTESVEDVLARHAANERAREARRPPPTRPSVDPASKIRNRAGAPAAAPAPPPASVATKTQVDRIREMFENGGGEVPAGLRRKE